MNTVRRALMKRAVSRKRINPTRVIVVGFLLIIVLGTALLMLPSASAQEGAADFVMALFTATSATCISGLVVVDTATYWTGFGQGVILAMIQIGGLGFMSIITVFYFLLNRRIGLRERLLLAQSFSTEDVEGVVRLMRNVLIGTLVFELAGAIALSACFIPDFGVKKGVWLGVFHSVSAFCNAGFDLMGSYTGAFSSFEAYAANPVVNITLAVLITVGGLGFFVWDDIMRCIRKPGRMRMYTKLVLIISGILLVAGTLIFLALEYSNPDTMGGMTGSHKLLAAFFQSVTSRSAGFATINQAAMSDSSKLVTAIFMAIGGSSGSTAGGIRTVTAGILCLSALSVLRSQRNLVVFGRSIAQTQIRNAIAITVIAFVLSVVGGLVISALENAPLIDSLFEAVSAYATCGLSAGVVEVSGPATRLILALYIFLGKAGIMSLSLAFMFKSSAPASITWPEGMVMIG